jgi:hypothetical protein
VVVLPGSNGPVGLISVTPGSFWSFVYEHADGIDRITLSEEELAEVELFDTAEAPAFDGDPEQFRLGLEARRIKTTFTYDMAAVAVSNIRPLPHQLEAVYEGGATPGRTNSDYLHDQHPLIPQGRGPRPQATTRGSPSPPGRRRA